MAHGYDPRCKELAVYFLQDESSELNTLEKIDDLAQTIQDAVEDWIAGEKHE